MEAHVLSLILLIPAVGVLLIMVCPPERKTVLRSIAVVSTGLSLLLALYVFLAYDRTKGGLQFLEQIPWIEPWGIDYVMAVDGLSVPMVLLNAIAIFTGVLASLHIEERVKEFFSLLIFLASGVFGVFMTQDLFFFALFYEVAVLPMYLLIAVWGSGANREYAAFKLTLMLFAGSAFVMTGILMLYGKSGLNTFSLIEIKRAAAFSAGDQRLIFLLFFIGFGSIVPSFPLHTWSPEGHACAPTAVSMLHAGVLMKLGGFGLLRIAVPLLPAGLQHWAWLMMALSFCNIVYGAFAAIAQDDMKFMIGFSSVSHMGMVLFGISTMTLTGLNGAAFQMFAHGIVTALYFSSVGVMYNRTHTRKISELGGIGTVMPRAAFFFAVAGLAGLGLPGFAPFVAELLVFIAGIKTYPVFGILGVISVVATAFYVIRCIQRVYFGPVNERWVGLGDGSLREVLPLVILVIVLVTVGFYPRLILDLIQPEMKGLAAMLG